MIGRVLALAIGLFTALAASQVPEYAQQYRQRLGGAIDELRRVADRFEADARAGGRSRDDALDRLARDPEPLTRRQGENQKSIAERLDNLERQRRDFSAAPPLQRVLVLLRGMDTDIARATYLDFEPAAPITQEGLISAATGFVVGWIGILLLARTGRRVVGIARRRRRDMPEPARSV